jgi:hypothetical protein
MANSSAWKSRLMVGHDTGGFTTKKSMSDRMKLFRFGQPDHERPGVLVNGNQLRVTDFGEDYNEAFFATDGIERLRKWLVKHANACPFVDQEERIAPCISRPSKIVCVGLNYRRHAVPSQ